MPEQSIEHQIKEIIVERLFLKITPEEIDDDALLMETLGVDSVSVFEIVVGLEDVFGINFDDDEFRIEAFRTVRSTAATVRRRMPNAGAS